MKPLIQIQLQFPFQKKAPNAFLIPVSYRIFSRPLLQHKNRPNVFTFRLATAGLDSVHIFAPINLLPDKRGNECNELLRRTVSEKPRTTTTSTTTTTTVFMEKMRQPEAAPKCVCVC